MKRIIAAALILGLSAPAFAEERGIGTGGSTLASRSGTAVILVDPTTGLPTSITTTSTAFAPSGNNASLSATTTSSNVSFGSATTVAVSNTGSNTIYIVFGTTSGVTATTSGYPVFAGQTVFLAAGSNTYVAGITSTGTSTLVVTPGSGVPAITGGGSSSGGAITIASGGVASGAYAAGSIASGAAVSGSIADLGPYTTANTVAYFLSQIAAGTAASSTLPIYCANNSSYPSYTNATNNALSCDLSGNARVVIGNGSTAVAVKAASTSAAATDPALVVSLSPNTTPVANASAFLNDANATATQIVALSGTTKIYVSAYSIVASVAENVKFQYGTGTNCGTGTTDITSLMAFAANGGIAAGSGMAPLFVVPAGNALCVTASTTGPTAVNVSYAQF